MSGTIASSDPTTWSRAWVEKTTRPCGAHERTAFVSVLPDDVTRIVDHLVPGAPPPDPSLSESDLRSNPNTGWQRYLGIHIDADNFHPTEKTGYLCIADLGDQANFHLAGVVQKDCASLFGSEQTDKCDALSDAFTRRSVDPSTGAYIWRFLRGGVMGLAGGSLLFGPTLGIYRWFARGGGDWKEGLCRSAHSGGGSSLGRMTLGSGAAMLPTTPVGATAASPMDGQVCSGSGAGESYVIATDESGKEIPFSPEDLTHLRKAFFHSAGAFGIHMSEARFADGSGRICVKNKGAEENRVLKELINKDCETALADSPHASEKCVALGQSLRAMSEIRGWNLIDSVVMFVSGFLTFGPIDHYWHSFEQMLALRICDDGETNPLPMMAPENERAAENPVPARSPVPEGIVVRSRRTLDRLSHVAYGELAAGIGWGTVTLLGGAATGASAVGTGAAILCPADGIVLDAAGIALTTTLAGATSAAGVQSVSHSRKFIQSLFN